ncbi:indoleamine 2,3-dioxygenase-like protein [Amylocarpus encephaloides]|uniref:Indoleamine 2,3-dioxygenase n=1 Tax=Amylocarpus encephaloides TaxID=45428 RepID=A0A9P7YJI8_9HELO|nr:indoleamine 2,3-dioxygenase-like protein [Amylocarpus encephaloides]
MLGPPSISFAEYSVSSKNGFLPDEAPLQSLPNSYYQPWETAISQIHKFLSSSTFRQTADSLPILTTAHLTNVREWQRAYLILSFFTHAYIWESGGPSERLPPQISIPFLEVAAHFGLPPTATYSAFNLWNWAPISPEASLADPNNLRCLHTFTNTIDEEWFYLISVAMEAHGATIIPLMVSAIDGCCTQNSHLILGALTKFGYVVREIGVLLKRMNEKCDPMVFFHQIRPFLAGSKDIGAAGLPRGVFYSEDEGMGEGAEEKGEWRMYSGGSNAQSSLIQFLDTVLGVDHTHPKSPTSNSKPNFLSQMRAYMPAPHRAFLTTLSSLSPGSSPIRDYASTSTIPDLVDAYNFAVKELENFRTVHIGIVMRYIIMPSKRSDPLSGNPGPNIVVASSGKEKELKGTGGTELLPFLRGVRDETRDTAIVER